jgi:hypothetical protein
VVGVIFDDSQGYAFIFPVIEVLRRVTVYAYISKIAGLSGDFVLAEPIVKALLIQQSSPVGVDMHTVVIQPEFTRLKTTVNGRSGFICRCNLSLLRKEMNKV